MNQAKFWTRRLVDTVYEDIRKGRGGEGLVEEGRQAGGGLVDEMGKQAKEEEGKK